MYQALYRKWRPKTFGEVVGQSHITDTLQRQVAEGQTAHAYLFTGTRGTGKTTCARIMAKAVNCLHPIDGAPCNECEACRGIDDGTLLDVTELDAASNNGVDQVRALREEAIYTPSVLKKRVYIIDEVHMLSTAAFNALLKILEEPPEHLMFILATTELHKVPATILSRCQRFSFKRILPYDMERQLNKIAQAEHIDLAPDGAEILARMANGALRDALSLLDQCRVVDGTLDSRAILDVLGLAGSVQSVQLMQCILQKNTADALLLFDQLYRAGKDVAALLGELSDLGRDLTIIKAAPDGGGALLTGIYDRKTLANLGKDLPMRRFLYITSTLQACCATLPGSAHPRTNAELCLLRLCDETLSGDLTALEERVANLESGVPMTAMPARPVKAPASKAPKQEPVQEFTEELPPMPEEPDDAVRVFDVPEESVVSAPTPKAASAPQVSDDNSIWTQLMEHYKGRLPVQHRVFLNMAQGILHGDVLEVRCNNDFVKNSLDNDTVTAVLQEVTAQKVGHPVRVEFSTGSGAPAKAQRPVSHKKAPASSAATPPCEPAAPMGQRDQLDDVIAAGKNLDHFNIK